MASVNWSKIKGASGAKAMLRHDCKDTRLAAKRHGNQQLDASKTPYNYGLKLGADYADACARYDARIAVLDSNPANTKRKDRVTAVSLCFPTPAELPKSEEKRWMQRAYEVIRAQVGRDNVVGMWVHQDEQHDYLDPATGETTTSRVHAHVMFIPELDGRLCAKQVTARQNMVSLNNALHQMSETEFHVPFLDGSKQKSRGKVEDLKRKSAAKLAELAAELERREARLDARERALDEREASLQERERKLKAAEDAPAKSAAASPVAPTKRGPRSLASIRQQTHASARTVDGYAGQGYEKGR